MDFAIVPGTPSLLARNSAKNFGREWSVVDVAVDRGTIDIDFFPKRSGLQRKAPTKGCYGLGVLTIGSKDTVLKYNVPMAPGHSASVLCEPRRCCLERFPQHFAERAL